MYDKVKNCALRLLARREHSRRELRQKLSLRKFPIDTIESVLNWLVEQNYQNDVRFAQAYVNSRIERGYGKLKIHLELKERGVSSDIFHQVTPHEENFWHEQLVLLWHKKFRLIANTHDNYVCARQQRFFQSRGFSSDQIKKLWTSLHEKQ